MLVEERDVQGVQTLQVRAAVVVEQAGLPSRSRAVQKFFDRTKKVAHFGVDLIRGLLDVALRKVANGSPGS